MKTTRQQNGATDKKILFVVNTHGDEPIGQKVVDALHTEKKMADSFDVVVANPVALAQNKRFTDVDLNRSAPGDKNSPHYESRRAFELMEVFKKYDYVVDFHETLSNDKIVMIIAHLTRSSLAITLAFDVNTILIWPPSSPGLKVGPLMQYKEYGTAIEAGVKTSLDETAKKVTKITQRFLENGYTEIPELCKAPKRKLAEKKFYLVYEKISADDAEGLTMEDFVEVKTKKGSFVPLLFGRHRGLIGYKMKEVDALWIDENMKKPIS